VSIRQATSGICERISRQTATPFPSGSRTSSTATSGRSAGMRASACCAVLASPMTSIPGSVFNNDATPRRTTSWSSKRNTLMGALAAVGSSVLTTSTLVRSSYMRPPSRRESPRTRGQRPS
jgi:hypothetical protein